MSNPTLGTDGIHVPFGSEPIERHYPGNTPQSILLVERIGAFPSSGEILRKVDNPSAVLARIKSLHAADALEINEVEGLSLVLPDWRFKLRISNNEHVIYLRVESRGDVALMQAKTIELLEQVDGSTGSGSAGCTFGSPGKLAHDGRVVRMTRSEDRAAKAWYLVQCKATQDDRAEKNLVAQGYTCFRPKYRCERVLQGRRRVVSESLFPSYLFIQLGFHDNWGPLRSTRGVLRVVSFGGNPLPVRDALIARLHERNSDATRESQLISGEAVRINEGPFVELEAVFLTMDGEARVVLLMNFLQREQRVNISLTAISRI